MLATQTGKKYRLPIIILSIVLCLFLALVVVYRTRSPVLIVTDISFRMLCGEKRLKNLETGLSRALFRRVVPVVVNESAGPDLIALAAEGAHESPWAVLFPYRYIEGARNFINDRPDVPVLVMAGGVRGVEAEEGFAVINTDTALDLYRAGLCAALIAGEDRVFFISDGTLTDELKDIFQEGLREGGHLEDAIWTYGGFDYSSRTDMGCVVIAATANVFLDLMLPVPVILFSWMNPAYTPTSVKLIFDDSPMAFAVQALKLLPKGGEEVSIASSTVVFKDRIAEKKDFRKLNGLVMENLQNE